MEQDVLKKLLKDKGLKVTGQRQLVLEIMAAHPGEHLTAEEIFGLAREQSPEIGLATVYRALQVFIDLHVIDRISLDDGFARFELSQELGSERHHHHHAICLACKRIVSLEEDLLGPLEDRVMERLGFSVADHEVKLYGYCRECNEKRRAMIIKKKELEESD